MLSRYLSSHMGVPPRAISAHETDRKLSKPMNKTNGTTPLLREQLDHTRACERTTCRMVSAAFLSRTMLYSAQLIICTHDGQPRKFVQEHPFICRHPRCQCAHFSHTHEHPPRPATQRYSGPNRQV